MTPLKQAERSAPTPAPDGLVKVAWWTSRSNLCRLSKVHLSVVENGPAKCGAKRARGSHLCRSEAMIDDHEQEEGLCSRCWSKAIASTTA